MYCAGGSDPSVSAAISDALMWGAQSTVGRLGPTTVDAAMLFPVRYHHVEELHELDIRMGYLDRSMDGEAVWSVENNLCVC